jgi:hypothetical protein
LVTLTHACLDPRFDFVLEPADRTTGNPYAPRKSLARFKVVEMVIRAPAQPLA